MSAVSGEGPVIVAAATGADLGAGGEFHSIEPARVLDTRLLEVQPLTSPSGRTFEVDLVGRGGLPSWLDVDGDRFDDRVLAVALSIVVVGPSDDGFLSARPAGTNAAESSLVNFVAGEDISNSAILQPGESGRLLITLTTPWAARGTADVVIDVFGWFSTSQHGERGARLMPIDPIRVVDTRRSNLPLGPGGRVAVPIWGTGPIPSDSRVVGVIANLTAVNNLAGSTGTYLSVVPQLRESAPTTSNLNLQAGAARPVTVIVPVGPDGLVVVRNEAGRVHVIVDVMGYLIDGADPMSRVGRVVPLTSPARIIDTRRAEFGAQPAGPTATIEWGMTDFMAGVEVAGTWIGPQSAVIGNLTAANLRQDEALAEPWSFVTVGPAGSPIPDTSILNIVAGRDVANLAVIGFGESSTGEGFILQNAFGYVDVILDASAVVLDDWPEEEPSTTTTSTSTSTSTSTTLPSSSTSSTTTTTTSSTTTTTSTTTSTTSTTTTVP